RERLGKRGPAHEIEQITSERRTGSGCLVPRGFETQHGELGGAPPQPQFREACVAFDRPVAAGKRACRAEYDELAARIPIRVTENIETGLRVPERKIGFDQREGKSRSFNGAT